MGELTPGLPTLSETNNLNFTALSNSLAEVLKMAQKREENYRELLQNWIDYAKELENELAESQKNTAEKVVIPLYYVKFPVSYGNSAYLDKYNGLVWVSKLFDNIENTESVKFTEPEIKAIDERYWPFAVPVEEEDD